jgi:ADP-ribose pyrophosphatase YjhB (NUDIX family)
VVILDKQNRILLVREKMPHKANLWHIPAGSVEEGESLEKAAIREAKEETGLDVHLQISLNTYLGRFPDGEFVARHVWLAKVKESSYPTPMVTDEIAECRYVSKEEFDVLYQQKAIRMYHTKLMFEEALELTKKF